MKTVRLGYGTSFWGDRLDGAYDMVRRGDIKYLCNDHLAELTMCILQKMRRRDPTQGYTRDLIPLMQNILPVCREKGIKIVDNGGGANPQAAQDKVIEIARKLGIKGLKVAAVVGDDLLPRMDELLAKGHSFKNLDTGEDIKTIKDRVVAANAYVGHESILDALKQGADVVMTGRATDIAVVLAPLMYEFGWSATDWDRLANASLVGHLIECTGQTMGGLFSAGWRDVPEPWNIGYPIVDFYENGDAVIGKTPGTGGRVSKRSLMEQMVYEIHDPRNYMSPDVIGDFTTAQLEEVGENRVKVTGTKGKPAPATLKVGIGYDDGFMGEGRVIYTWPDAYEKAKFAAKILLKRLEIIGVKPDETRVDYIGINSVWGSVAPEPECEPNEVELRVAIKTKTKEDAAKLGFEVVPLFVTGPAGAAGVAPHTPPREVLAWWPALVPREEVKTSVIMKEA